MSPLLAAAASPAFLAKGCVNVIELDALKEIAGERWQRIRDGVYARLESLLRSKLGPNDFFIRLGDTAYLITMPTTDAEDVSAMCTRVAFDLHTSFLGECGLAELHVNSVHGGEDDSLILRRLPASTVAELAERVGIYDQLSKHDGIIPPGFDFDRPQTKPKAPANGQNHKASAPAHSGLSPVPGPPGISIEHQFMPVWSVPNAAVTTYLCEPKSIRIAGRPSQVMATSLEPRERHAIEMAIFHRGIDVLMQSFDKGTKFLMNIPLSFDVLGSPAGRMEVLSTCRNMTSDFRSLITYVICNVPQGVGQTVLANMVTALSPFARGVGATVHPAARTLDRYESIGLKAVGYNLAEFAGRVPFQSEDAERLAQFARRKGLGTFLYGVRDKRTLQVAQDANIQFMCGEAVTPAMDEPRGMWRLTWEKVLSKPDVELWV